MRRFGMMYDKTIEDEQEKEWVFEMLVEKGAAVLPALKKYMMSADSISWPLRLLDKVVDPQGRRASTSSPRCSRATSRATNATRPRRSSC